MKKILAMLLATVMVVGCFTGCGSDKKNDSSEVVSTEQSGSKEETPELDMSETVKMGILVSDATSAEALAFRTYYTEYIQKQYNVELIYSDELKDAAGETSAIDTFITNNCKAIISFSSFDRAAQIEQCEAAGVYYAVATGTLTDEEYETYKGYEHYVGAIGPSLEVEYQTGYDMANYYLEQGKKNFAIFGGAIPYYTDMHIYRAAGMIAAMVDAGGADANYKGATDEAGIIGQIYADGQIETGAISLLSSVISASICSSHGLSTPYMLVISIVSGALLGLISGAIYVIVKLPPIIVSLGVTLFYEGMAFALTDGYGVSFVANKELTSFPGVLNYVLVIVIGLVLFIAIFDYTQFGYEYKSLLSGQKVSVNTGIHEVSNAVICYTIAGGFMGVVGFISASNTGNIQMSLNFGSIGVMFTAFLPMFIGGFIGRFCNEKIGYLLGAVTTAFISLMYARLNVDASIQQIVTAVILVLFLIYLNNENKVIELVMLKKQLKKKRQEDN